MGYGPNAIERAIATLVRLKLIDDFEFSLQWAQDRIKRNPKSPWVIRQELKSKGVSNQTIDEALDLAFADVDLTQLGLRALRKRYASRTYPACESDKIRKRMLDFLLRRGFDRQLALEASRQVLSECLQEGSNEV